MTDDAAHAEFVAIRFADNGGAAFCPRCECTAVYTYEARRIWKCKARNHQFSVTSGTIFASRKLPIRDYLAAIAIFVNAVKGISALQLGRDLDVQYKTAFVMAHKLREAMTSQQMQGELSGEVEVDGAYVGGKAKQANVKADRKDRRIETPAGRQSVIVARERNGNFKRDRNRVAATHHWRLRARPSARGFRSRTGSPIRRRRVRGGR